MPNDATRKPLLEDQLADNSVPFTGIQVVDVNAVPPVVNVTYAASATQEQINLGETIKGNFDWRQHRPLALSAVKQALATALPTSSDRVNFILGLLAELCRNDVRLANRLARLAAANNIVVDEVVP